MMPAGIAPAGIGNGMAAIQSRIAAIQSRLDSFVPPARGGDFDLNGPSPDRAGEARATGPRPNVVAATAAPATAPTATAAAAGAVDPSRLPDAAARWLPSIERAANEAGIDPALLTALVRHESNFDQSTISHAGAIGLAQLMPGTAEWLNVDPFDPEANLAGGARYLKEQLDRFGKVDLALAAYNAGPNRVAQAGGIPRIAETQIYVERVLNTWEQLR